MPGGRSGNHSRGCAAPVLSCRQMPNGRIINSFWRAICGDAMFGSKGKIAQLLDEARNDLAVLMQDIEYKDLEKKDIVRRIADAQRKIIRLQDADGKVHDLLNGLLKDV